MGMGEIELKYIIDKHGKWLRSEDGGQRADLRYADLSYADLRYADLRSADLRYADLSYADLRYANLSYADLRYANLRSADLSYANLSSADLSYANLRSANLSSIKTDFFERLLIAKSEVTGLYDYLMRGKINGLAYEGECACFAGTIAKVAHENYKELSSGLKPDSDSPTEKWFLAIHKGDTPQSNQVSDITRGWIEEFCVENKIILPQYKIVSSIEAPGLFEPAADKAYEGEK